MLKLIDIETNGLNSLKKRVTCICIINEHEEINSFFGEDEKKILEDFWNDVETSDNITGFNIDDFDLPFILRRSLINNVRIKPLQTKDIRKVINNFFLCYDKKVEGTMRDWATLLKLSFETDDGEMMIEYFGARDWKKIVEHCIEDVTVEYGIYKKLKELNFL